MQDIGAIAYFFKMHKLHQNINWTQQIIIHTISKLPPVSSCHRRLDQCMNGVCCKLACTFTVAICKLSASYIALQCNKFACNNVASKAWWLVLLNSGLYIYLVKIRDVWQHLPVHCYLFLFLANSDQYWITMSGPVSWPCLGQVGILTCVHFTITITVTPSMTLPGVQLYTNKSIISLEVSVVLCALIATNCVLFSFSCNFANNSRIDLIFPCGI